MHRPLVSIIIPCYNSESFVADAIQCSLDQTYQSCEIIVIDDGSTDRSAEIIESFGERIQHVSSSNKGGCSARNLGFEKAMGSFIQFLDSDDLLAPDKIDLQVKALENSSSTLATCPYLPFSGSTKPTIFDIDRTPLIDSSDPTDWLISKLHTGSSKATMPHCFLTPRELIEKAGPWDESLCFNQDGEFFARVLLSAKCIQFVPNTKTYYRRDSQSSISKGRTSKHIQSWLKSAKSIERNLLENRNTTEAKAALRQCYLNIIHTFYPEFPDELAKSESAIHNLGFEELGETGGRTFRILCKLLGFKSALKFREALSPKNKR